MTTGNDRCVWYAAYGSNMLQERFLCYINHPELRDEEIGEYLNSRNAERGR
ncbi:MAG: hypothetical protein LBB60_04370 [Desulfovibrio sp.]|jgi:hypothetical protein|nr:hypothetical protein [Desulfovibrio sp.]